MGRPLTRAGRRGLEELQVLVARGRAGEDSRDPLVDQPEESRGVAGRAAGQRRAAEVEHVPEQHPEALRREARLLAFDPAAERSHGRPPELRSAQVRDGRGGYDGRQLRDAEPVRS